jgi:hypothetical protein
MRILIPVVLVAVLATGLWQRNELSRLEQRELSLREGYLRAPESETMAEADIAASLPARTGRRGDRESFDPAAFVEKLAALIARHQGGEQAPEEDEGSFVAEELASASPRELKELVSALRRSSLPEDLVKSLYWPIAPRLAESDPEFAADLAWEAGEWRPFKIVLRSWIARDPVGAAAWFAETTTENADDDSARFRALEKVEFEAMAIATRLSSDPGVDGVKELLLLKGNPLALALAEVSASLPPGELATVMSLISHDPVLSEMERLDVIGNTLAGCPDPVVARQVLLDAALPADQFAKAAAILIGSLDPVGKEASIAWAKSLPDPRQREELLRVLATADSP